MAERYWHEVCFTGPQNVERLIEAAEAAGYNFEFGSTEADENFVGTPVKLDEAKRRIKELEGGEEPLLPAIDDRTR